MTGRERPSNLRVTSWCEEVETSVDASVMVGVQ